MGQKRLRSFEKLNSVRQSCVQFKGSFVNPLRMYCEHNGLTQRFKYVDLQATWLVAGWRNEPKQRFAKCCFFPRLRLEADDEMERQGRTPQLKSMSRGRIPGATGGPCAIKCRTGARWARFASFE